MASIKVRWDDEPVDVWAEGWPEGKQGVLTDEHAACSYGLPVLVDGEGRAYGPGDLPAGAAVATHQGCAHFTEGEVGGLLRRARAAGFVVRDLAPER